MKVQKEEEEEEGTLKSTVILDFLLQFLLRLPQVLPQHRLPSIVFQSPLHAHLRRKKKPILLSQDGILVRIRVVMVLGLQGTPVLVLQIASVV